jgi:hypothetical protein
LEKEIAMFDLSSQASQFIEGHVYVFVALFLTVVLASTAVAERLLKPSSVNLGTPLVFSPSVLFILFPLGLLLFYAINFHADLTFSDACILFPTASLDKPQMYLPPIFPNAGRFFPLAHQEFQFLALISKTLTFYNVFVAAEFMATLGLLSLILKIRGVTALGFFLCLLSVCAIAEPLFWPIPPERNLFFLFSIMLAGADAYRNSKSRCGFWLAIVSGSLQLFYKEIAFIFVGAFAATAIVQFMLRKNSVAARRLAVLGAGLILAIGLWAIVYAVAILPQINVPYYVMKNPYTPNGSNVDGLVLAAKYLFQPWLYVFFAAVAVRFFFLRNVSLNAVFDGLPFGVVAYAAAIVILKFDEPYYSAPAAFGAYVFAAWVFLQFSPKKIGAAAMLLALLAQTPQTFRYVAHMKEMVAAKSQAVSYLLAEAKDEIRLHSLDIKALPASLFAGLLHERFGKPVVFSIDGFTGWKSEKIDGFRKWESDGPCLGVDLMCHAGLPIKPGDFIVKFSKPAVNAPWPLVFTSAPIGFWENRFYVYVYKAS